MEQLRRELGAKDDIITSLENENRKLKDRVRELSQLTDVSIQASQSSMKALKDEVCAFVRVYVCIFFYARELSRLSVPHGHVDSHLT